MKPSAKACAILAMDVLDRKDKNGNPIVIPYVNNKSTLDPEIGADCQGYIEAIVRELGGKMEYPGSNGMWRNALWVGTVDEAIQEGRLVPGAGLLIVRHDGKEPPKYKKGGAAYKPGYDGNAAHVGWYTGGRYEVVHSSGGKNKKVNATTIKAAGFTHVIWFREVDYTNANQAQEGQEGGTAMTAIVKADKGNTVRLRRSPDTKGVTLANVPVGKAVEVLEKGEQWCKVRYNGTTGYMMTSFLSFTETEAPVDEGPEETEAPDVQQQLSEIFKRLSDLEEIVRG